MSVLKIKEGGIEKPVKHSKWVMMMTKSSSKALLLSYNLRQNYNCLDQNT
jgi:hypothetical protein